MQALLSLLGSSRHSAHVAAFVDEYTLVESWVDEWLYLESPRLE